MVPASFVEKYRALVRFQVIASGGDPFWEMIKALIEFSGRKGNSFREVPIKEMVDALVKFLTTENNQKKTIAVNESLERLYFDVFTTLQTLGYGTFHSYISKGGVIQIEHSTFNFNENAYILGRAFADDRKRMMWLAYRALNWVKYIAIIAGVIGGFSWVGQLFTSHPVNQCPLPKATPPTG